MEQLSNLRYWKHLIVVTLISVTERLWGSLAERGKKFFQPISAPM
jgi:hypothetical protein